MIDQEYLRSLPSTAQEARDSNSKYYFTGKPCKHGHIDKRSISNRICYTCALAHTKLWAENNSEYLTNKNKQYRIDNHEAILVREKEYRAIHKEELKVRWKSWRSRNEDHLKEYRIATKEVRQEYNKENKERINSRAREYQRKRRAEDPKARIDDAISGGIFKALRENKGGRKWESLVGYTLQELEQHMESLFTLGMSWSNYGKGKDKWNIGHIKPKCAFSYTIPEDLEFKECWKLANLIPQWELENMVKSIEDRKLSVRRKNFHSSP